MGDQIDLTGIHIHAFNSTRSYVYSTQILGDCIHKHDLHKASSNTVCIDKSIIKTMNWWPAGMRENHRMYERIRGTSAFLSTVAIDKAKIFACSIWYNCSNVFVATSESLNLKVDSSRFLPLKHHWVLSAVDQQHFFLVCWLLIFCTLLENEFLIEIFVQTEYASTSDNISRISRIWYPDKQSLNSSLHYSLNYAVWADLNVGNFNIT